MRLLVDIVRLIALVLSAPLLLSRFVSPYRLSYGKFYLDELYSALIVAPLRGWRALCASWTMWSWTGWSTRWGVCRCMLGTLLRSMQTGLVQFYALAMVLGGLVLLLAIDQQLSARVSRG